MKRMAAMGLTAVLALLAAAASRAEMGPEVRWADPAYVKLSIEFPGQGYHAEWELFRCSCGDLLVRSELSAPDDVERGETLLVGGLAVLSRGFAGDPELGSSLDAPALMMQLALRLLERAEPGGPGRITEERRIDLEETINPIYLESYAATGMFQAPWTLRGEITPAGEDRRRFDLLFEFSAAEQEGRMRLRGQADFADLPFPLEGSDSLAGWQLTWRDEENPVTTPASDTAATLDELRAAARARQSR